MADRKQEKAKPARNQATGKHFSESSPNPHGESKILHMPINTDQRNATGGRNVAQIPNTTGGKLNPSVVHEFKSRVVNNVDEQKRTRMAKKAPAHFGAKKKDA